MATCLCLWCGKFTRSRLPRAQFCDSLCRAAFNRAPRAEQASKRDAWRLATALHGSPGGKTVVHPRKGSGAASRA